MAIFSLLEEMPSTIAMLTISAASCVSKSKPNELIIKLGQLEQDLYHNASSSVLAHVSIICIQMNVL